MVRGKESRVATSARRHVEAGDKLASWGLANAHLDPWGPFGRGWSLKRFSTEVIQPQDIPLIAYPKAWSPRVTGELDAGSGKIRGVFLAGNESLRPIFQPWLKPFKEMGASTLTINGN